MHQRNSVARLVQPPPVTSALSEGECDDLAMRALAAAYAAALSVAIEHWAAHGGDLAEHLRLALSAFDTQH